jgi:hypothetical protein
VTGCGRGKGVNFVALAPLVERSQRRTGGATGGRSSYPRRPYGQCGLRAEPCRSPARWSRADLLAGRQISCRIVGGPCTLLGGLHIFARRRKGSDVPDAPLPPANLLRPSGAQTADRAWPCRREMP